MGDGEEVTITTAAARVEKGISIECWSLWNSRWSKSLCKLGLLSGLNAALFLERVTAGEAVAGGAVSFLGAMAGG